MRFDLPIIAARHQWSDESILYLDVDVMVLADLEHLEDWVSDIGVPYFAAAPEFDPEDWSYFNAGVMLLNLKGMGETQGLRT